MSSYTTPSLFQNYFYTSRTLKDTDSSQVMVAQELLVLFQSKLSSKLVEAMDIILLLNDIPKLVQNLVLYL